MERGITPDNFALGKFLGRAFSVEAEVKHIRACVFLVNPSVNPEVLLGKAPFSSGKLEIQGRFLFVQDIELVLNFFEPSFIIDIPLLSLIDWSLQDDLESCLGDVDRLNVIFVSVDFS